jgi:hypothetical protein
MCKKLLVCIVIASFVFLSNIAAAVQCNLEVSGFWSTGYTLAVNVINNTDQPMTEWQVNLNFTAPPVIENSWSAEVLIQGNGIQAKNMSWNGSLAPGQVASFGVLGRHNNDFVLPKCVDAAAEPDVELVTDRSLFIHDSATLSDADFSLNAVLTQLAVQFNQRNPQNPVTARELFARFWDTQNAPPGLVIGGDKCTGSLNGFTLECRPAEGIQASDPDRFMNAYIPIALVNRFDLRDKENFNDCGEYRIVYALKQPGIFGRNFIIFEAQLPNPTPGQVAGCLGYANFWSDLSLEDDPQIRAQALHRFYFEGLVESAIPAVVHIDHYSLATGQIRTNQFLDSSWNLKEFKAEINAQGLSVIKPVTVKSNPVAELFSSTRSDAQALAFQSEFVLNLDSLLKDFDHFSLTNSDQHNNGQSHANGPLASENFYAIPVFAASGTSFQSSLANKLTQLNSSLTAQQVVNRATAMTCAGCHEPVQYGLTQPNAIGPGESWPNSTGFTHVSEFLDGENKFIISSALKDVFLPVRLRELESYLQEFNNPQVVSSRSFRLAPSLKVSKKTNAKRSG